MCRWSCRIMNISTGSNCITTQNILVKNSVVKHQVVDCSLANIFLWLLFVGFNLLSSFLHQDPSMSGLCHHSIFFLNNTHPTSQHISKCFNLGYRHLKKTSEICKLKIKLQHNFNSGC